MTVVEVLALILIAVTLLKMIFMLLKPQLLIELADRLYRRTWLVQLTGVILAGVIGYYLYSELSLAEIMAVFVLAFLVMGISLAPYEKQIINKTRKMVEENTFWSNHWLGFLVWLALIFWTSYELIRKLE
ncbi:MAG: hypothetical protein ACLFN5_02930 [bacterium]